MEQGTSIELLNAAEKAIRAYHNAIVCNRETLTRKEEDTIRRYYANAERLIKLVAASSWTRARELRESLDRGAQTVGDRGVW